MRIAFLYYCFSLVERQNSQGGKGGDQVGASQHRRIAVTGDHTARKRGGERLSAEQDQIA